MPQPVDALDVLPPRWVTRAQGPRSHHLEACPDWARMVLARPSLRHTDIAEQMGVSIRCVDRWAMLFELDRIAGLRDCPGHGRRRSIAGPTLEDEPDGAVLRDLTEDHVRDGSFASVQEFRDSIMGHIEKCNHYTGSVQTGSSHGEPRSLLQW